MLAEDMRIAVNKNWQAMHWHKVQQWRSGYLVGNVLVQDATIERSGYWQVMCWHKMQ
jgi:hypothetical protein